MLLQPVLLPEKKAARPGLSRLTLKYTVATQGNVVGD